MFFNRKKNNIVGNKPVVEEERKLEPWEELGLTKEEYEQTRNMIYAIDNPNVPLYVPGVDDVEDKTQSYIKEFNDLYFEWEMADTGETFDEFSDRMEREGRYSANNQTSAVSASTASTTNPIDEETLAAELENLQKLIGIEKVKAMIDEVVIDVKVTKQREQFGQYMPSKSLNMVFLGNPGTGKTTVAKQVGKIMQSLGVLEKGHFKDVTREDLVSPHVGETALKTRKVLEEALGGVLLIDEAYSLARGNENDFGREAIDCIVKYMEEHKGEILIILAGYEKEMEMLWKSNSGLKSRFPYVVVFDDYTTEEMVELADMQAANYQVQLTDETKQALAPFFAKKQIKGRSDNGNGRLVRNEIESATRKQSKRLIALPGATKEDFEYLLPSDFGIVEEKEFDLESELATIVGNEALKEHLRRLQATIKIEKMRNGDNGTISQSLHMIFKGNAGTGKTTIARIVGKMFKELGVCKKGHVVEVTRTELVGGYVGQTAPKVHEVVQSALGGILFIDEAYSLVEGGANDFGREAINTLVAEMENNRGELIVIAAGYEKEMKGFIDFNSGMASRFPYHFTFEDYSSKELCAIFVKMMKGKDLSISNDLVTKQTILGVLSEGENKEGQRDKGNGRFVRNVVEKAIQNQSYRLSQIDRSLSDVELRTLVAEDFVGIEG